MKPNALPSLEELHRLLSYDPITGIITWEVSSGSRGFAGAEAGCPDGRAGYRQIQINGRRNKAHRIAWKMATGLDPSGQIDHISGNTSDNSIANLRTANHMENMRNACRHRDNKSGVKGVSWSKSNKKWLAQVSGSGRHIGFFDDIDEAAAAVRARREESHGEFARHE